MTLTAPNDDQHIYEVLLLREILDLLPYSLREETLLALLSTDGRKINKAGRKVRKVLPEKEVEA